MAKEVPESSNESSIIPINYKNADAAHYRSEKTRKSVWESSIADPERFWSNIGKKYIDWFAPFDCVSQGSFIKGDIAWFLNGKLNVSYNCIDRWVKHRGNTTALIWEGDDPSNVKKYTFKEVQEEVCKIANVLKKQGVKKGDIIVIYMPMIPQAAFTMLACTRIGAPHSVIFGGFGKEAIRDRVNDAEAKYIITANEQHRKGKQVYLKQIVDAGIEECKSVEKVLVYFHDNTKIYDESKCNMVDGRDYNLNKLIMKERPYCPCEVMDSEDTLFLLYTSGSTGKPKGVLHSTAGYLAYAMATHKYVFDIQIGDIYACVADIGWITGHSYIVYGPLANGATTFMFEGTPTYPDNGRYWDMVQRHKITQFYTAPTAIRALLKFGDDIVKKYDRSSLRVLGTVGEPINPEAWLWYYKIVGDSKCPIVDTYWQTETGGIIITPLPGATPLKPGSATLPFFGIEPVILNKNTGKEININDIKKKKDDKNDDETKQDDDDNNNGINEDGSIEGILVIKKPWPGMARTVYGDHQRYLNTYMKPYPGYYFTGDGAKKDKDGYYWITGRVDDVLNVAGHRIGTAEIESVVTQQKGITECAVVGIEDQLKGQAIFVYAIAEKNIELTDDLRKSINNLIRKQLGAFYTPKYILLTTGLPKTRSGKIMRRILRKIASNEYDSLGDITTLADPTVVKMLIEQRKNLK